MGRQALSERSTAPSGVITLGPQVDLVTEQDHRVIERDSTPVLKGGRPPSGEYVEIECPICGEASRSSVLASAYVDGWCIGSLDPRDSRHHKPKKYVVLRTFIPVKVKKAKTPNCQSCGKAMPKRHGPGRYPRYCEGCK